MLVIFAAILAMYMSVEISMFNPDSMDGLKEMMDMLPQQMINAMNLDVGAETSLVGFLGSYFYGFIVIMVPMIFNIIASNNAAAKLVDSGAMACLLSAPNSRTRVILTQAAALILSNILLMAFVTVMGIAVSQALFPGDLDIHAFLLVNAGACFCSWPSAPSASLPPVCLMRAACPWPWAGDCPCCFWCS